MKETFRRLVALVAAVAIVTALGLMAGCAEEEPVEPVDEPVTEPVTEEPADGSGQEVASGQDVLEGACVQCHDASRIFVQGYGADWSAIVEEMNAAHGAALTDEEQVAVVEFLGSRELSAGEDVIAGKCSTCHDAQRIYEQGSAADWAAIVQQMTEVHGAQLTDAEKAAAIEFLEGL
ncbi:MAG: hypothetical protein JW733_03295 [Coriobacteriia bacterium]|nr:hypothetical protein [Coriobacteriia bacterium]MBN2839890.1 hypothetical protein [Coriobacteriia bacterium]